LSNLNAAAFAFAWTDTEWTRPKPPLDRGGFSCSKPGAPQYICINMTCTYSTFAHSQTTPALLAWVAFQFAKPFRITLARRLAIITAPLTSATHTHSHNRRPCPSSTTLAAAASCWPARPLSYGRCTRTPPENFSAVDPPLSTASSSPAILEGASWGCCCVSCASSANR